MAVWASDKSQSITFQKETLNFCSYFRVSKYVGAFLSLCFIHTKYTKINRKQKKKFYKINVVIKWIKAYF